MPSSSAAAITALVTAAYLARAGRKVLVLERRELVGGCAVTEELWPGFKVSTASYVNSLFRPEIIRDLELKRHGFEMLPRSPSSFTPFPDGRYLLMGPDKEMTHREISKFSKKDAEALPKYEAMLERVADFLEPTLVQTPPNPWSLAPGNLLQLLKLGLGFRKLGTDGQKAIEILTGAANPILDRWFESEELKATLATDAIIGAFATPSMPGTAYVLFHHVMGECDGVRGVWGYVRGGMGGLSATRSPSAAQEKGAEIRTNAAVAQILVKEGRADGVALADGTEYQARKVVSGRRRATSPFSADGSEGAAGGVRRFGPPPRLRQRQLQDQPGAERGARLHLPARATPRARSTAARSTSARPATISRRPSIAAKYGYISRQPDHRGDHPFRRSTTRWRPRAST